MTDMSKKAINSLSYNMEVKTQYTLPSYPRSLEPVIVHG